MSAREKGPLDVEPVKCLLVDDREDNLWVLSVLLRQQPGVEVLTARSGAEALELLLVHDVALALLDVHMPEMDGFELAELIRGSERTRNVPLIFVTAGARDPRRAFKGYETGAVDFLYKPVEPQVLIGKAAVFFRLHRQQRALEREVRERTQMLAMHELFTAALGHDLRSPLSAILNSAEMLRIASSDPLAREAAERIVSSGRRMSRMIEDMTDVARARLGDGLALEREPVDLLDLVRRVVREQQSARPEARLTVTTGGDTWGSFDAARLSRVVSNLLGNAIQHGDVREPIDVTVVGEDAGTLTLAVTNAGTIPDDLRPRIFDPFRGRSEGRRGDGLGLGLYIVQQIVAAHGGRIEVLTPAAGRVTFRATLPRGPVEAPQPAPAQTAAEQPERAGAPRADLAHRGSTS